MTVVVRGEQRLVVNKDLWRLVSLVVVTLVLLLLVCSNLRRKRWPFNNLLELSRSYVETEFTTMEAE